MIIGFSDIESTGVKVEFDRICEFALIAQEFETGKEIIRYERKINPQVHIPAKTTAIHGIADADVVGAPAFREIAPLLGKLFAKLDYIVFHNGRSFDMPMILHEFIRAGVVLTKLPIIIDTMLEGHGTTPDGKMPTLGELCWSLDVPYDKALAHRALYDVEVMAQAWRRGVELGVFQKPIIQEALAA